VDVMKTLLKNGVDASNARVDGITASGRLEQHLRKGGGQDRSSLWRRVVLGRDKKEARNLQILSLHR
jgi:hypothetical protein